MGKLLVLALAAAFYPTLLAIVILILTRPRPLRLLIAFFVGAAITSVTIGLVILFAFEGSGLFNSSHRSVGPGVDLAVGLLSLTIAVALTTGYDRRLSARRRARKAPRVEAESRDPWTTRLLARDSLKLAFGLGIVLDLPSVWYLAALKRIDEGNYGAGVDVLLVVAFNLVMFLLVEVPLVLYLVAPERAEGIVDRLTASLRTHGRQLGATVAAIVGAYLTIDGLTGLL